MKEKLKLRDSMMKLERSTSIWSLNGFWANSSTLFEKTFKSLSIWEKKSLRSMVSNKTLMIDLSTCSSLMNGTMIEEEFERSWWEKI